MNPELSVVVATFRRPTELVEAVRSALAQKDVRIEVLVVDDSPEGSARAAIERLGDRRVRYLKMPWPSGGRPSRVRNVGWPRTLAPIVHFLDDDDRVPPGTYRKMLDVFRAHPERGVVFGRVEPFGDDPGAVDLERRRFAQAYRRARDAQQIGSRHLMVANVLFLHSFLITSACMIRRTCLEHIGGYDPDMRVFEDLDMYAHAIRRFGCAFLDDVVLEYRISPSSLMHSDSTRSIVNDAYRAMHARYLRAWGRAEFFAMKLFARGVLRAGYVLLGA
jgi:glycosyltransferase involved in cell wall biosynthesis